MSTNKGPNHKVTPQTRYNANAAQFTPNLGGKYLENITQDFSQFIANFFFETFTSSFARH